VVPPVEETAKNFETANNEFMNIASDVETDEANLQKFNDEAALSTTTSPTCHTPSQNCYDMPLQT
jgi:hypothetical protein